jgi:hypothetical protein
MDLSDILAGENTHLKTKEAEALEVLGAHSVPAMKTLDGLKREFGHVVPSRELVMFVSPAEGELYKDGKRKATRILFDAYAEVAIRQTRDPEAFIELLGAIQERVAATMTFPGPEPTQEEVTLIDKYEAELCRLAWVKTAWERATPSAFQIFWRKLRALLPGGVPGGRSIRQPIVAEKTAAVISVKPDGPRQSANAEPAKKTFPAQPVPAKNAVKTANRAIGQAGVTARALWLKDRLLERGWGNSDPSSYGGPDRKTIEKILRGEAVRNDVLEKLAESLSSGKHAKVKVLDIPRE